MNSDMIEMSKPKLRFKEFNGTWEPKKFNEILDITRLAGYEYSTYWQEDENKEIIALRGYNIGKGKLELRDLGYISNRLSKQLIRSRLSKGDIVYPCVGTIGNAVVIEENDKFHIQQNIAKLTPKENISPYFIAQFLMSDRGMREVNKFNATSSQPNILVGSLRNFKICIPLLQEQIKVANFLKIVDEKISFLTQKYSLLTHYKKGLTQKILSQELRFKDEDGSEFPKWDTSMLEEILEYEQPTKYLVSSVEYDDNYVTPVLTAGKTFILGYTDEKSGIFQNGLPVIIFDDFTTAFKFVSFPFKAKSSAMKILKIKNQANSIKYVYEAMQQIEFPLGGEHKRYWISEYSKISIPLPSKKEQTKIANFLSAIDEKIKSAQSQLELVKQYKQGLLQQMFV
jgi:type I restriction enzyme S subunit